MDWKKTLIVAGAASLGVIGGRMVKQTEAYACTCASYSVTGVPIDVEGSTEARGAWLDSPIAADFGVTHVTLRSASGESSTYERVRECSGGEDQ